MKVFDLIKKKCQNFIKNDMFSLLFEEIRGDKLALLAILILGSLVFCAIFADFMSPHSYKQINLPDALIPPSMDYPLGTDHLGRDVLSRLIHGTRTVIWIVLSTTILSASFGIPIGLISGYYGRIIDTLLSRVTDIIISFPYILLAIFIQNMLGIGLNNAIIAVSMVLAALYVKFTRGLTLAEKERLYVESERALGAGDRRIIFLHILPNIAPTILVQLTLYMAYAILSVSALTFLGLGAQPPAASWGLMVFEARIYMRTIPHLILFPGCAIFLVALALNVVGETFREVLTSRE